MNNQSKKYNTQDKTESLKPESYRLCMRHAHTNQPNPVLQGYYTWQQGTEYGGEWRDIPTIYEI